MPQIKIGDFDVYHEIWGSGSPLLLLNGLGFSVLDWGNELLVELAKYYQIILFDYRDTGRTTSHLAKSYTIADLADDVARLLDALEVSQADFFGVSMGGMIAQQFALRYPDRLRKMVLGGTVADGAACIPASITDLLGTTVVERLFTPEYIVLKQEMLTEFFQRNALYHSRLGGLLRQLQAISTHDTRSMLGSIQVPSLILIGEQDIVTLPQQSQVLAQKIPHAEQQTILGAGHGFYLSHPQVTAAAIVRFLNGIEGLAMISFKPSATPNSYPIAPADRWASSYWLVNYPAIKWS